MAEERFYTGDASGSAGLIPPVSQRVHNIALSAGSAKTVYWPAGYEYMVISAGAAFWFNDQAVATVPVADNVAGNGSVLSPGQRKKNERESFSLISATAQTISIEFWK